jgi:nucleotide-binding universal stress UspA family protein
MERTLLHVYRNTPLGRETLLQSAYFCEATGCTLQVYVPRHPQFLLYFDEAVSTVGLDATYLRDGETAAARVTEIAGDFDVKLEQLEPTGFTAPTLPHVKSDHSFMACPRSMSELATKIRFGHLGPRVRAIVQKATFPVLLPTPVFKPWKSVIACFGGSDNSVRAAVRAQGLARDAHVPFALFTYADGKARGYYEEPLEQAGILDSVRAGETEWHFIEDGDFVDRLYDIPRDALVAAGAYGHGAVREAFFGSKLETIQTEVPNNLLVVGPNVPA